MFSDIITRHQVMVERLKTQTVRDWSLIVAELLTLTRGRLAELTDLRTMSSSNRDRAIKALTAKIDAKLKEWRTTVLADLGSIAAAEHAFEAAAFGEIVASAKRLTRQELFRAIQQRPLSMTSAGTLTDLIDDFTNKANASVIGHITRQVAQAKTNVSITRSLKPIADQIMRGQEAVARSAIGHASSAAREAVWLENAKALGAGKYRWRAILDSKTCAQCQGLDLRVFDVGAGPLPPIHQGCRCFAEPIVDEGVELADGTRASSKGQTPGDQTYFDWLKKQKPEFQDMAIGPVRGKLLRDGGLTSKRFQELTLDRNFAPMTLREMKQLEPLAFERAKL